MGTFGIVARFPLGTYSGHRPDGSTDSGPDPARLHAALTHAAYTGSTAEFDGDRLVASARSRAALEWLEENPPVGIQVPKMVRQFAGPRTAYRKEGLFNKENRSFVDKTTPRPMSDGLSLAGDFGWSWNGDVPDSVRTALEELCQDVSCLGEGHSLVQLRCGDVQPNWIFHASATRFSPGGVRVRVARPGRLAALDATHEENYPKKSPTISADKHVPLQSPRRPKISQECVEERRYVSPARPTVSAPWTNVVLVFVNSLTPHADDKRAEYDADGKIRPIERQSISFSPDEHVAVAVSLHRALAKRIGEMAPPLITGRYGAGSPQPANRVAIQVLSASLLAMSEHADLASGRPALALMIPHGAHNDDILVLHQALRGLRRLVTRFGTLSLDIHTDPVSCADFWRPPASGAIRLWGPSTAVVPEGHRGRGSMSLDDSVLLSFAYVMRDLVFQKEKKTRRQMVDHLKRAGITAAATSVLPVDASRYVHRVPASMVPQPCSTIIDILGAAQGRSSMEIEPIRLSSGALVAIGQSRHLGGGLLAPIDLPFDAAQALLGVSQC